MYVLLLNNFFFKKACFDTARLILHVIIYFFFLKNIDEIHKIRNIFSSFSWIFNPKTLDETKGFLLEAVVTVLIADI